jgi:tetratricopeptide (TPR) repeat protein
VRDLIDTWVVCDTGSSDGTPELVRQAFDGIDGELFVDVWEDFGTNRTKLLERARGRADYLLLLDADHTLVVRGRLGHLDADAYSLVMDESAVHWLPRLVKGDLPWHYVGATHEYLACDAPVRTERCPLLIVEHHADGSNRAVKSERDLMLLEKDLAKDPDNPRTVFYLAQTYREMGEEQLAIDFYARRVALGGWDEEMFYSMYWRAELVSQRDWDLGVHLLMEAFEYRPSRVEPLYSLVRGFRARNQYQLAATFAARALKVPLPADILFVHRDLYTWGVELEWSICAFHLGDYEAALSANERLLTKAIPDDVRVRVEENREVCLIALGRANVDDATRELTVALSLTPLLSDIIPGAEIGEIRLDVDPPWPQFNPSIAADGAGFKLLVRTSNYRMDELGRYSIFDDDGVIRSLYYEVAMGTDLSLTAVRPIVDTTTPEQPPPGVVMEGIEDCRLVQVGGRWFALAASRQFEQSGLCRVALAALDDAKFGDLRVLSGPDPARHEKNWVPFTLGDELFILYSCAPTVIYRYDLVTGALSEVSRTDAHFDLADERGSSQGLAVDGGTLFVTHRVSWPAGRRLYDHRFVLLDDRFRVVAATPHFSFRRANVEFCAGMARSGDDLVLSFGTNDAQAFLARVPYEAVRAAMWPL